MINWSVDQLISDGYHSMRYTWWYQTVFVKWWFLAKYVNLFYVSNLYKFFDEHVGFWLIILQILHFLQFKLENSLRNAFNIKSALLTSFALTNVFIFKCVLRRWCCEYKGEEVAIWSCALYLRELNFLNELLNLIAVCCFCLVSTCSFWDLVEW